RSYLLAIRTNVGFTHDLAPFLVFRGHERSVRIDGSTSVLDAETIETLDHIRHEQYFVDIRIDRQSQFGWHVGRADYAVPAGGVEIFESLVSHGGDVGKSFGAFESRLGEGIQLPALHVRGGCRHGVEAEIDLPADQVRVHGPRSAIGNMNTVDVRRHVEHRSGQMLDRARAGRTEGDFS